MCFTMSLPWFHMCFDYVFSCVVVLFCPIHMTSNWPITSHSKFVAWPPFVNPSFEIQMLVFSIQSFSWKCFFFPCLLMQNWSRGRCTGTPHIFWPTFRNSMEFQSILPGTSIQWSWNHPAFGALSMPQTDQRHQVSLRGPVWMEPVIGTLQPRLGECSGFIQ